MNKGSCMRLGGEVTNCQEHSLAIMGLPFVHFRVIFRLLLAVYSRVI